MLCIYIYGYGYVPLFYVVFPVLSFRIFMSQSSPLEVNVERHVQYLNWPPACLPVRQLRHLSVGDCDCGATGKTGAGAGSVAEAGHGLLAPVANRQRRSNVRERDNWPQSAGGVSASSVSQAKQPKYWFQACQIASTWMAATAKATAGAAAAAALWLPAKKSSQTRNWGTKFNINININSG